MSALFHTAGGQMRLEGILMPQSETTNSSPGLLPPGYFLVSLLAGAALHVLLPVSQIIPWPYRLLGCLPLGIGGLTTLWADQVFKQRNTTVKPHLDPTALITNGPFRISRHPMYLGMTMSLLGIALLLGSTTAFVAPIAFALIMQFKFIPMEERSMERTFGEKYGLYKRRVRRWI
jgi:protein-S-isoprenylcysteine O-methyltransferase Ste14